MTLLLLFSGAAAAGPVTPTDDGAHGPYGGRGGKWEYDRPYLSEYAEALRLAFQKKDPERVEELAEKIVELALGVPVEAPRVQQIIDVSDRLRHAQQLEMQAIRALVRTLVIRARAFDRFLQDEEDAEMLLLG